MKPLTEETFLKDIKDHKMTIICDQGNTRHIRFKNPKHFHYYFDFTTWENYLCVSGDVGVYVFRATEDMFCFFRMDKEDFNYDKEKTLQINIPYWHEKLESNSTFEPAMEFSSKLFNKIIVEELNNYCDDNEMNEGFKKECLKQLQEELFYPETEEQARELISNGKWASWGRQDQGDFAEYLEESFSEIELKKYTDHFIWCLYAIVWGIKQYDKFKEIKQA